MRRHVLCTVVLATAMVLGVAPAATAASYQQVVDITFPVAGATSYVRDYDHGRSGGRVHRATDLMADYGVPIHAAQGGTVTWITGLDGNPPAYGYMITIAGDDGREYHYVHLGRQDGPPSEAYAPGLQDGSRVRRGQLIGYNGCSGNASCSAPHLHFQIEDPSVTDPYGSNYLDPYDSLKDAERRGDVPGVGLPLTGDWNGDGVDTPALFVQGTWYFFDDFEAEQPYLSFRYGRAGDKPVTGDWDGDGVDTVGVVRGNLWILRNEYRRDAEDIKMYYGEATDTPVAGDWDGDGVDTLGVVRGNLWILRSEYRRGADDVVLRYGEASDRKVVGDWDADGTDTLGIVRGDLWVLRSVYKRDADDVVMRYGESSDVPVTGDWNGDGRDTLGVVRGTLWVVRSTYQRGADVHSYKSP